MLTILINGQSVELYPNTSISLQYPNPLFEGDAIVTPYSFGFDLPLTPHNNQIFGWRTRVSSIVTGNQEYPAQLLFGGQSLIVGHITVTKVYIKAQSIEVQFLAADFLADLKTKLYELDLGTIDYCEARSVFNRRTGKYEIVPATSIHVDIANYWAALNHEESPKYATPTLIVEDVDWHTYANSRINAPGGYAKLPSVNVGYILNTVSSGLGDWIVNSELKSMMLICYYHPKFRSYVDGYQYATTDRYLYDIEDMRVLLKVQDVMPDVEVATFVKELLKLTSASLYTVENQPVVVPNNTVLSSTDYVDWSSKLIDSSIKVSYLSPQEFVLTLASTAGAGSIGSEESILDYDSRAEMVSSSVSQLDDPTEDELAERDLCSTSNTGQVFERKVDDKLSSDDGIHYNFELVSDRLVEEPSTELEKYEVNCDISPVCVVVGELPVREPELGFENGVTKVPYVVAPEVPNAQNSRPTDMIVGCYEGLRETLINGESQYPFVSDDKVCHESLCANQHSVASGWVSKTRRVIDADIKLGVEDIKHLDLRQKVYYKGLTFFVENLSVTITNTSIEPAEVVLVEAPNI